MLAIYKREVRSYFNSMIGCVFAAFLTIIGGVYFMVYNLYSGYPFFAYSLAGVIFMYWSLSLFYLWNHLKKYNRPVIINFSCFTCWDRIRKIFCYGNCICNSMYHLLYFPTDHQTSGKCTFISWLFFYPCIFPAWMCVYRNWNVFIFPHWKPRDRSDQYLCSVIFLLYVR